MAGRSDISARALSWARSGAAQAPAERIRRTWDSAAQSDDPRLIGTAEPVERQVDRILGLLDARRCGSGTCLEVGCGDGRMTVELARRWSEVLAVDVSPRMLERAARRELPNVRLLCTSGLRLDGVPDAYAETVVCYGVLQHLPRRRLVRDFLGEFARTLAPGGEAIVHLPVMDDGVASEAWRLGRGLTIVLRARLRKNISAGVAYSGARLTEAELSRALRKANLQVAARAELDSYFGHARNVLLRLELRS